MGDEEFVATLLFTNIREGTIIAERIRAKIENHTFKYINKATVSIGIAEKTAYENFNDWFKRADKAMYKAKQGGRNKDCIVP